MSYCLLLKYHFPHFHVFLQELCLFLNLLGPVGGMYCFSNTYRMLVMSILDINTYLRKSNVTVAYGISLVVELVMDENKVTKPPTQKGSEQYTQWVSELRRETAKVRDQEARRFFLTCRNYLDVSSFID